MNLEIQVDTDAEEVNLVLDNAMTITAYRNGNDSIIFSKNMSKITDDETYDVVTKICALLLNMGKE